MSNPLKYSTSGQSEALNTGNYWIGTGDVAKGPTNITQYWSSITPPNGGYTVYLGGESGNGPAAFCPANDDELISLTNRIAGTNYSTAAECLAYYAAQSNQKAINKNYPAIVTNGLVLLVDASYDPSYPTTGTTWYDVSGNLDNGTLTNGPLYSATGGGAISFDGVDDYVNIPATVGVGNPNTVCALIKLSGTNSDSVIYGSDANGRDNWFGISGNKLFLFATQTSDVNNFSITGTTTLDTTNTRWYFGTSTISGSTATIYLNGVQENTTTVAFTIGSWTNTAAIARRGGVSQRYFKGSISNVMGYNRALSFSEILQNYYQSPIVTSGLVFAVDAGNLVSYESGTTTTYSLSSSATGSLVNGVSFENMNGGTWSFDGTDDRISISSDSNLDFLGTLPYSIEVWGNLGSLGIGARMMVSRENSIGVGRDGYNILLTNMNSSTVTFSAERFASNVQLGINTSLVTSSVLNKWAHYVATYDGQFYRLFFNGSLVATSSSITSSITNTTSTVSIANRGTGLGNFINMKMAVVSIYNTSLSTAQVAQNFNARRSRFGV